MLRIMGKNEMYENCNITLKSSRLFSGIHTENLRKMLECINPREKTYRQREIITVAGSPLTGIGFIIEGKIALTRDTFSGNRFIMEILDDGDIFGEMAAFSGSRVWPFTVIAQEESRLFFLPPEKVTGPCANICAAHNTLILNMLQILAGKALTLNKKVEHLSSRSIRGKISSYLLEEYRRSGSKSFEIPMKRHELADYLSIPRPSLSREMSHMQDEGIIAYRGPRVQVMKIPEMEEAVR
jgi:CRP/FNR family transcriptional regulator, dissimilatory nitrate respiration regulator